MFSTFDVKGRGAKYWIVTEKRDIETGAFLRFSISITLDATLVIEKSPGGSTLCPTVNSNGTSACTVACADAPEYAGRHDIVKTVVVRMHFIWTSVLRRDLNFAFVS